jgi:hypothetical protein
MVTRDHKVEFTIADFVISAREPPYTRSKVCRRSPPKTTTFPPKVSLLFTDDGTEIISRRVLSNASEAILCVIKASSQMTRDAACISLQSIVPHFVLQVVPLKIIIGMTRRQHNFPMASKICYNHVP